MRCKVLVLTHGNLAEAFVHAVSLIYGEVPQLAFKNMPEQLDIGQYRKELEACVRENEATGILVVTDLLGGTPFLSCMQIIQNNWDKMEVITGWQPADASGGCGRHRDSRYSGIEKDSDRGRRRRYRGFEESVEGGKSRMKKASFARVDERLIHGQVMTAWVKKYWIKKIILVDDEIVQDSFMQEVLSMSAPQGVKVEVRSAAGRGCGAQ